MSKRIFILILGISLLATACAGNAVETLDETEQVSTPSAIVTTPTAFETENPTQTADANSGSLGQEQKGLVSECTLVSSNSEPPAEYADIFSVSEEDWVVGPEDAAVTLIEYGDFQ